MGGSKNFKAFIETFSKAGTEIGLTKDESIHLISMYGSNTPKLFAMINTNGRNEAEKYEMPLILWVKLKYALQYEMAATPSDFFARRTGDLLFDINSVWKYRKQVQKYMADFFGWNEEREQQFIRKLEQELIHAQNPEE